MPKNMYTVDPSNGYVRRFDGASWTDFVSETPPGHGDIDPAVQTACNIVFVWRGRLFYNHLYYAHAEAAQVYEIENLDATPNLSAAPIAQSALPIVTDRVVVSNTIQYRGNVVWLGWADGTKQMWVFVFGDHDGTGTPVLKIHDVTINSQWLEKFDISWRSDAHAGGHLFAHDEQLFWGPRGTMGETPSNVLARAFKIDIRTEGVGFTLLPFSEIDGAHSLRYWNSYATTPGNLANDQTDIYVDGLLCVGTVNGKLFYVRPNACVDLVDDLTLATTRAFDLRDDAAFVAVPSIIGGAAILAPGQLRFETRDILGEGTNEMFLLGGRVDVLAGVNAGSVYDIVGAWFDGTTATELALRDTVTGEVAPNLAGQTLQIRYGMLGNLDTSYESPKRGGQNSSMAVEHDGFAYIVVSTAGSSDQAASFMPPQLIKWDGVNVPEIMALDLTGRVDSGGIDMGVDRDAGVLHIGIWDMQRSIVVHKQVNLGTFTEGANFNIYATTTDLIPSAILPGSLYGYSTYEPYAQMVSQQYNPSTKVITLVSHLYSQFDGGLTNVSMTVEYTTGDGWKTASPHGTSGPMTGLVANTTGNPHSFVHDLEADEPGYIGPLQYRVTTFVP